MHKPNGTRTYVMVTSIKRGAKLTEQARTEWTGTPAERDQIKRTAAKLSSEEVTIEVAFFTKRD